MKLPVRHFAGLTLCLIGIAGCASAPYKPAGFSDQQVQERLSNLRQVCQKLKPGTYINIQFYNGVVNPEGKTAVTGYFYSLNKSNDAIMISARPLAVSDRGEGYALRYVADITPTQDTAMIHRTSIIKAVHSFLTVSERDPERQLLTQ